MVWASSFWYWVCFFSSGASLIFHLMKRFRPIILIKFSALSVCYMVVGGYTGALRKNISDDLLPEDEK
jgi:hypothetical protein